MDFVKEHNSVKFLLRSELYSISDLRIRSSTESSIKSGSHLL